MKKLWLLLFVLLPVVGMGQIITTIAGGGSTLGDGGPATAAHVYYPAFGAFDAVGNYYYEDGHPTNPRLRKINTSGVISTVVGNGTSGYGGDGGLATSAMVQSTRAFVDSIGNIYLADYENYRVRMVDYLTGIIHTVAGTGSPSSTGNGGPASVATLVPIDICVDRAGNIFVSDQGPVGGGPGSIRKIDVITGIIKEVSIGCVQGMCFNSSGFLYAGGGSRIVKIDTSTGVVDTIAGTSSTLYNGESVIATAANFTVMDMTLDTAGNIYIADHGNERVRVIRSDNRIYTVVGNGAGTYSGDGGLATAATIYNPEGVAFDPCGNLYIAASGNNRIRKVTFNPSCNPTLETQQIKPLTEISISPNPATTELIISAPSNIKEAWVYDVLGTSPGLSFGEEMLRKSEHEWQIDISQLPPGAYLLRVIMDGGNVVVRRFVKE